MSRPSGVAVSNVTNYNVPSNVIAVHFDADPSEKLWLQNIRVLSRGSHEPGPFTTGVAIAVWVWDDSRNLVLTSDPFDLGGTSSELSWRLFDITSEATIVQGPFYAGFQILESNFEFGFLHDYPEGADYDRSYIYLGGSGTWYSPDDDWMLEAEVIPCIPGDATGDGVVNEADAAILGQNWLYGHGMATPDAIWVMGDFNGDRCVDDIDATMMAVNWGYGESNPVPEPSVFALLAAGLLGLLIQGCRRGRRRRARALQHPQTTFVIDHVKERLGYYVISRIRYLTKGGVTAGLRTFLVQHCTTGVYISLFVVVHRLLCS